MYYKIIFAILFIYQNLEITHTMATSQNKKESKDSKSEEEWKDEPKQQSQVIINLWDKDFIKILYNAIEAKKISQPISETNLINTIQTLAGSYMQEKYKVNPQDYKILEENNKKSIQMLTEQVINENINNLNTLKSAISNPKNRLRDKWLSVFLKGYFKAQKEKSASELYSIQNSLEGNIITQLEFMVQQLTNKLASYYKEHINISDKEKKVTSTYLNPIFMEVLDTAIKLNKLPKVFISEEDLINTIYELSVAFIPKAFDIKIQNYKTVQDKTKEQNIEIIKLTIQEDKSQTDSILKELSSKSSNLRENWLTSFVQEYDKAEKSKDISLMRFMQTSIEGRTVKRIQVLVARVAEKFLQFYKSFMSKAPSPNKEFKNKPSTAIEQSKQSQNPSKPTQLSEKNQSKPPVATEQSKQSQKINQQAQQNIKPAKQEIPTISSTKNQPSIQKTEVPFQKKSTFMNTATNLINSAAKQVKDVIGDEKNIQKAKDFGINLIKKIQSDVSSGKSIKTSLKNSSQQALATLKSTVTEAAKEGINTATEAAKEVMSSGGGSGGSKKSKGKGKRKGKGSKSRAKSKKKK